MKTIIVLAVTALSIAACNNKKNAETTTSTGDTLVTTKEMSGDYSRDNAYIPAEGDVIYRNGKVLVWRNGNYVETDKDVELENGIIVQKNGEVIKADKKVKLEEGESVNKSGNFFDKAGNVIEDAWEGTKKGVKKAADAVEKAGKKAGEEVKETVN